MTRLPHPTDIAPTEPRPAGRPLYRDPTGNTAVGRASRRHTSTATVRQLRDRLVVAVRNDDGAGLRLLAHHLRRAEA